MLTPELIASPEHERDVCTIQRHIITSEYPPQPGGVSDYTKQVAEGLARQGEAVHVWCPAHADDPSPGAILPDASEAVQVHSGLGRITADDLAKVGQQLDRFPAPRCILVQYVPHGYGRRSMNVPFCIWLWRRAKKHGDCLEIMVHEPFLEFEGSWRQRGAALIHRLMTVILLRAATRVWFSAPEWERRWKVYALGRPVPFQWLPIPSNVRVNGNQAAIQTVRRRYVPDNALLLGHFGTYGEPLLSVLEPILWKMAQENPDQPLLLMGRNSLEFRKHLLGKYPAWEKTLHATGALAPEELSGHIAACDVLLQPYPDGATTRRSSLMVGISHGKAIVTTRSHATEPLWERSAAVSMAPAGDAGAFLKLLLELLQNPAERARMSQAALGLYQERFDISHTVAALHQAASEPAASGSTLCAS